MPKRFANDYILFCVTFPHTHTRVHTCTYITDTHIKQRIVPKHDFCIQCHHFFRRNSNRHLSRHTHAGCGPSQSLNLLPVLFRWVMVCLCSGAYIPTACVCGMAGALLRAGLNKDWLDLKSRCVSSTKTGANLMGGHMWQDKTQSTLHISKVDTYSNYISLAWSDITFWRHWMLRCGTSALVGFASLASLSWDIFCVLKILWRKKLYRGYKSAPNLCQGEHRHCSNSPFPTRICQS